MVLNEMNLELTIPEICFQQVCATDCYAQWQVYIANQITVAAVAPLILADAISILLRDDFDDHSVRIMNRSTLNLFTIIAGLHTVVFQQRSLAMHLPTNTLPIQNAVTRWQSAWVRRSDSIHATKEREPWQDIGFIGQAQEFAWLVLARLDISASYAQLEPEPATGRSAQGTAVAGRLDDTSMSLVTDLMLSLTVSQK